MNSKEWEVREREGGERMREREGGGEKMKGEGRFSK